MQFGNFAKNTKGVAGVHLVVARLSLAGNVALPTTRNLKSVDVVAFNEKLSQFAFIQVKSTDKPKGGWPVYTIHREEKWQEDVRHALALGERFFYVFVSLPTPSQTQPEYYVVPSVDVAEVIIQGMERWLAGKPGRKAERQLCAWEYGGPRPDVIARYRDKWERLKLDG